MTDDASLTALEARLRERGQLIEVIDAPPGDVGARGEMTGRARGALGAIRYDSRQIRPGDVFVARRGQHVDAHGLVPAAVAAGAAAVVVERPIDAPGVPVLVVRDARVALALAAAWRAGDPSQQLGIVGITGTDGKTTTAYLARAILEAAGHMTGLVGTTDVIVGGRSLGNAARATTPEAPELQGYLAAMREAGDAWAVVESTSHGLAQERVGAVAYDIAALTNVTSEHLELHGTLEAYREAKRSLFRRLAAGPGDRDKGLGKHAVVNADDAIAPSVVATARGSGAHVIGYRADPATAARRRPGSSPRADGPRFDDELVATRLDADPSGVRIEARAGAWRGGIGLQLPGRFNAANALAALGVAWAAGLDLDAAAEALGSVAAIPGRMQRIDLGQPFTVVVDYAHTAEALAAVLDELAPAGRDAGLIAVFGSAGDRDTGKRPTMGRVAGARCRLVVLTDEDPRSEDGRAILDAIAAGAEAAGKRRGDDLLLIADRAEAIAAALARARPGDVVLLAGKGHEATIEMADGPHAWDEAAATRAGLTALGYG